MGGSIFLSIIQHFSIPVDSITCFILLFNFTILGVMSLFSNGVPIFLRQAYMVLCGIIVASWFTKLPEWTTWTLLVALAVYDLVAVLVPGGPLKILVELASSRDEELPALVYEARPVVTQSREQHSSNLGLLTGGVSESGAVELQPVTAQNRTNSEFTTVEVGIDSTTDEESSPLVSNSIRTREFENGESEVMVDEEMSPLVEREENERESSVTAERGIRLGLGDFVFYSVLVGRAAMYDLMTVYACYLAIISGLGCTLILLALCRHALPALPISIALGIIFYFLTRLLMEPFVVGTSTNLIMF